MKAWGHIKTLIIAVLAFAALFVLIIYYTAAASVRPRETVGFTSEEDFSGIFVPASENDGLYFDTQGFINGSGVYIFLPSSADLEHLVFYSEREDGKLLERFEHDFEQDPVEICGVSVFAMKSELPSINLSFADGYPSLEDIESSEDHDLSSKGTMEMWDRDGFLVMDSMVIRGRGNTTWLDDKKPYQITLAKGESLLGMGKAKTWVLLANAGDFSLLRNEVFLSLAKDLGIAYTPNIRQVDLFIDGEYHGAYSLCEKVEVGKNRVDIDKNDYLYCIGVDRNNYSFFLYDDAEKKGTEEYEPMYGELRDTRDRMKIERSIPYIQEVINEMYDPKSDLSDCDLDSFARYYWLQEFSKTTDPTLRSVYLYWKSDEAKMHMGPAWDYDRTAGIIDMPFRKEDYIWPDGWTAREQDYYRRMIKNPVFQDAVRDVYENGGVREAFMRAADELPARIGNIRTSAEMNFIRWNVLFEEENNKVSYAYGDNSYESQVSWLADWLRMRADWIDIHYRDRIR
ncbi:CotH protein [Lachnospiraceae bacterium]|nr:CotH protein [Lachnospiraceae bacterium]